MIYIKTEHGWFYTGTNRLGQCRISWNRYAITYWDSKKRDFTFPGRNGYQRSRGMKPIDPATKLKMWTMGKDFPLFDEDWHLKQLSPRKRMKATFTG